MVPVILSVSSIEDLNLRLDGYSAKEIRRYKVARLLKEAYEQDGAICFTHSGKVHRSG